jgi:hypothetical protein
MLSKCSVTTLLAVFLLLVMCISPACELDTQLSIENGNPVTFVTSGNGSLRSLTIVGNRKQRDVFGEDAWVYWSFKSRKGGSVSVGEVGPIHYGETPDGYEQVYPERGPAPPLVDGEKYNIRINTANANGADKYFVINNGHVKMSDR